MVLELSIGKVLLLNIYDKSSRYVLERYYDYTSSQLSIDFD
jgi:hypothetical protein